MKVSHELTVSLLPFADTINDYDYCLPHQLVNKQYEEYFINASKNGRFIILDNGLFENQDLGVDDLIKIINKIKPSVFIVPDEWNNRSVTAFNAKKWRQTWSQYIDPSVQLMGVMQVASTEDAINLYQTFLDLDYKYISFNHSLQLYKQWFPDHLPLMAQTLGRQHLINTLNIKNILCKDIYHHLLGCSLIEEFSAYSQYDFIKSVDTSNPIALAYENKVYNDINIYKPTLKIDDIFNVDHTPYTDKILNNIYYFKKVCGQVILSQNMKLHLTTHV